MWKIITDFPNYEVSTKGEVRNRNRGVILKTSLDICGYEVLQLYKEGKRWYKRVHRLVAEAYLSNPENLPEVNHKDANKTNNETVNLEWVTQAQNLEHAFNEKLLSKAAKFVVQYDKEGNYINEFESATAAAKHVGCHVSSITSVTNGYAKSAHGYVWRKKDDVN
jgi:hypothetical protein